MQFFQNGTNIGTGTSTGRTFSYPNFGLGFGWAGEGFNGLMEDVRLYNVELGAGQIDTLYSNGPSVSPIPPPPYNTNLIPAASVSLYDVSNAVSQAVSSNYAGVLIPAGTNTWNGTLVVAPIYTNSFVIISTNIGNTVITNDQLGQLISWQVVNAYTRLSGITFEGGPFDLSSSNGSGRGIVWFYGTTTELRVDHCLFDGISNYMLWFSGWIYGVCDHCTFNPAGTAIIEDQMDSYGGYPYGDGSWADQDRFGTTNAFYIEDCNFTGLLGNHPGLMDGDNGARVVIRYCNSTNCPIASHGTDNGGRVRSFRCFEIYNNNLIFQTNGNSGWGQAVYLRGGTALIWSNTIYGGYKTMVGPDNYRDDVYQFVPFGQISGVNPWDSNAVSAIASGMVSNPETTSYYTTITDMGQTWTANQFVTNVGSYVFYDVPQGYGCQIAGNTANTVTFSVYGNYGPNLVVSNGEAYRIYQVYAGLDQFGFGQGDLITNSTPVNSVTGTASWPHEQSSPIYCWSNSYTYTLPYGIFDTSGAICSLSDPRDVFTNTMKVGYIPLVYPHPLAH